MITIIDYGLGNTLAFVNIYKRMNIECTVARSEADLENADHLILPGVGAFDHAMNSLNQSGMRDSIERLVVREQVPLLGICVGMQMLAKSSDEGRLPGLGWVAGRVKKFDVNKFEQIAYLPHMGWNNIVPQISSELLAGIDDTSYYYFLHSYYFESESPANVLATTIYGQKFSSVVKAGNVYGVQCHPEKSHGCGARLLKNFAEI